MNRIVACTVALLAVGCDGGREQEQAGQQEEAAPAAKVAACGILSKEEVAEVLGAPVQRTEPRDLAGPSGRSGDLRYMTACTYVAERGQAVMTTTLMLQRSPDVRDPAAALNAYVAGVRRETPGGYTLEPVADLGPGAGWHAETTTLWVFRPGWMVSLAMDRHAAVPPLEGATTLTTKALERLP
jgi:hypothetical protein